MTGRLTINDLRAAGFCVSGIKAQFPKMGLDQDFRDFVRNGTDLDVARALNDAQVDLGIAKAEERIAKTKGAE